MMETACGNGYSPGRGLSAMMMSLKWSDYKNWQLATKRLEAAGIQCITLHCNC